MKKSPADKKTDTKETKLIPLTKDNAAIKKAIAAERTLNETLEKAQKLRAKAEELNNQLNEPNENVWSFDETEILTVTTVTNNARKHTKYDAENLQFYLGTDEKVRIFQTIDEFNIKSDPQNKGKDSYELRLKEISEEYALMLENSSPNDNISKNKVNAQTLIKDVIQAKIQYDIIDEKELEHLFIKDKNGKTQMQALEEDVENKLNNPKDIKLNTEQMSWGEFFDYIIGSIDEYISEKVGNNKTNAKLNEQRIKHIVDSNVTSSLKQHMIEDSASIPPHHKPNQKHQR